MDPQGQDLVEAILRVSEVALAKKRENTRLMGERLKAGQAALKAKEGERSMLTIEKDRVLALKEDGEKLVSDFLEADGKKNFDDQKAMMDAVVAMINSGGGDGGKSGGFDGFYERGINYLENAQNLDEKAVLATVKGTNSDGNGSSHGGGNGGDGGEGGGFDGVYGGPINDLENAQILDEEAVIATVKGTNSDGNGSSHGGGNGGDGGKGGGFDGVYGGPINDLENAQILDEEAVIATVKGTNSDENGSSHGGGNGGGYGV